MDKSQFKARLSEVGMSQSQAALAMGVPEGTLKAWLHKDRVPDGAVAKLFGHATPSQVQQGATPQPFRQGAQPLNATPDVIDDFDVSDVDEIMAEKCGYRVGAPHSMDTIKSIFAGARRAAALKAIRDGLPAPLTVAAPGSKRSKDMMSDGWLRGRKGDTNLMRKFRTEQHMAFMAAGFPDGPVKEFDADEA